MGISVVVTGYSANIGRTGLVADLARRYAAAGRRVLVVDMDGDGDVGRELGATLSRGEVTTGWCEALFAGIAPVTFTEPTPVRGLVWLPAGDYLEYVEEAFEEDVEDMPRAAQWAMKDLKDHYDVVLIDAPGDPTLPGTFLATASADLQLELVWKGPASDTSKTSSIADFLWIQKELNPRIRMAGRLTVERGAQNSASRSKLAALAFEKLEPMLVATSQG